MDWVLMTCNVGSSVVTKVALLNSLQWLPADHWIKYELLSLAFGLSAAWPQNILLISSLLLPYLNFMTWCFSTGPVFLPWGLSAAAPSAWTIGHLYHIPASIEISLFQKVFPAGSFPTPVTLLNLHINLYLSHHPILYDGYCAFILVSMFAL